MNKTVIKEAPVRERKAFPLEIKSLDDATGRVTGYLSTFDNIDETGDRVKANAYKRTLANKYAYKSKNNNRYLMPLLWQHNTDQPIGGFLELREDAVGLFFDMEIDLEVQQGRDAYSGLKKGYISQTSIGYDCLQSEYVKEDGKMVRDLLEIRLWEGSIVTFPANVEAVVTSVKNDDKSKVNSMDKKQSKSKKDFNDHYRSEVIEDWLHCDFNNLTNALRAAILDMFSIGDEPQSDIETTVLNDGDDSPGFITALKAYVQKGIDLNVSNYLNELQQQGTGYGSPYYLMSRGKPAESKEGRAISAANQGHIQDHVKALNDLADKADGMMKEHTKAVRSAADDLATVLQGSEPLYTGSDNGTPDAGRQEGEKSTPSHIETRSTQPEHSSEQDTAMSEQELDAAIRLLKSLYGTSVYS